MAKAQAMTNCQPIPIRVHSDDLHYVDEYINLGQLVDFQHTMERTEEENCPGMESILVDKIHTTGQEIKS